MLNIKFHPDVANEIKSSYLWYQNQAEGLGQDYLTELESSFQTIRELLKHGLNLNWVLEGFY